MNRCCLHHVEFGVKDGKKTVNRFISQFEFKLIALRKCAVATQWLLTKDRTRFLVTELKSLKREEIDRDPYVNLWFDPEKASTSDGADKVNLDQPIHDSAFNISLEVKNIERCVRKLVDSGVKCCKPLTCLKTDDGNISLATFESCVGNIKHTLVQRDSYSKTFLPGFELVCPDDAEVQNNCDAVQLSHIDHVTLVTNLGTSNTILGWYEKHFGMTRFLVNREEDETEGFVINTDNIGIRLMAFEYWKCAEVGLVSRSSEDGFKFVIGEALAGQGPNQITTFMDQHGGPGVQHIGLHTPNILATVAALSRNGVKFAEPPSTYYTKVGKLRDIEAIGMDVDLLRGHGILVDLEADSGQCDRNETNVHAKRYLMQKFTCPIFDCDTFFLEVIQRAGATGFGSGNISALWRSVQAYLAQKAGEETD